jgi:hypothetical protein
MAIQNPVTVSGVNSNGESEAIGSTSESLNVSEQSAASNTITLETTGTGSGDATVLYENTDVTPYNYVSIQVTDAPGTGLTLQESNDGGTTYNTVIGLDKSDGTYKAITTATGVWKLPLSGNAFKIVQSGTGTPDVLLIFGVE